MNRPHTYSVRIECGLPFDAGLTRNPPDDPNNPHGIWTHVLTLAARSGLTVLTSAAHPFVGGGITGVAILAESSLALHTWPEDGFALVEVTTCGANEATDRFAKAVARSARGATIRRPFGAGSTRVLPDGSTRDEDANGQATGPWRGGLLRSASPKVNPDSEALRAPAPARIETTPDELLTTADESTVDKVNPTSTSRLAPPG